MTSNRSFASWAAALALAAAPAAIPAALRGQEPAATPPPAPRLFPAPGAAEEKEILDQPDRAQEVEAERVVEEWLKLVDAGQYGDSWETAAALVKSKFTKEDWAKNTADVRKPLGTVYQRVLKARRSLKKVPGGGEGKYVAIIYFTVFANKNLGNETVTVIRDPDGAWRVGGYIVF